MPLRVEAAGHSEWAALADIARLFSGSAHKVDEFSLESPWASDLTIRSRVDPPVSEEESRTASRAGYSTRKVMVTTCRSGQETAPLSEEVFLHDVRRTVKRQLYLILSQVTGIRFPWGALTGVRPTQIALRESELHGNRKALERLSDYWQLAPSKAELALETATAEEKRLLDLTPNDAMVYVGLPFCPSRCLYCSFITQDAARQSGSLPLYVEAVIREARGLFQEREAGAIAAVYYGGGTPTSLPAHLFGPYLQEVLALIPLKEGAELTLEAGRPDTIDREKLELARRSGFGKLCINPQTMHDRTLRLIGRRHTVEETLAAFRLARDMGFRDINMDLIAGLPQEEGRDLIASLEAVIALGPESITLHTLAVKKGSYLDRLFDNRSVLMPDPSLIEAVEEAHDLLRRNGYRPYYLYKQKNCRSGLENTGFTRAEGSLYNVAMMSDRVPVYGLGSGSSSKVIAGRTALRIHNPKDLQVYIDRVDGQIARKRNLFVPQAQGQDVGPGEKTGMNVDSPQTGADNHG